MSDTKKKSTSHSTGSPIRILRVTEETGDGSETWDFEIQADYLKVSEVWSPMAGNGDVILKSDDHVIPLSGNKISEIDNLVLWMKRDKAFDLSNSSFRYLGNLAQKYQISLLLQEIHQHTFRYIYEGHNRTLELWKFAGFHNFPELFVYCLGSLAVCREIMSILNDPDKDCMHHLVRALVLTMDDEGADGLIPEDLHRIAKKGKGIKILRSVQND